MTEPAQRPSTRERILDAAIQLFAEEGYTAASISRIESQAGLAAGRGGLFRHFPSKEALLRAAVEREVERCRTEMEAARLQAEPLQDGDEGRAEYFVEMLEGIRRFDRLFRLMLTEGDRVPELRDAIRNALEPPGHEHLHHGEAVFSVAVAALGGYHLFSIMQGRSFNGVDLDHFIEALVLMTQSLPERPVP